MSEPAGRLENPATAKPEPRQSRIHRLNHRRRCIVRVERGGPRRCEFLRSEQRLQFGLLRLPLRSLLRFGKDLRDAAPADIAHEHRLFIRRRGAFLGFDLPEALDRGNVEPILLLQ